jgi:hypothetical protein
MAKGKVDIVVDVKNAAALAGIVRRMERLHKQIIKDIAAMDKHYRNRIAAHKAHTTMAKQRIEDPRAKGRAEKAHREDFPFSPDDRITMPTSLVHSLTKKGEAALRTVKKLKVVKIKGI